MAKKRPIVTRKDRDDDKDEGRYMVPRRIDDLFEDLRRNMDRMFGAWPWFSESRFPAPLESRFPALLEAREIRTPPCDLVDRGDKYELMVEVPGMEKEKIDLKTTKDSVEISAQHSKQTRNRTHPHNGLERPVCLRSTAL